jgi:hypothetical protein
MRRSALTFALAVLCLAAVLDLRAQSCVPIAELGGYSITGPKCSFDSGNQRCEAGSPVTFTVSTYGAGPGFPESTCPFEMKWEFGDGVTDTTTGTKTNDHTYASTGVYRVVISTRIDGAMRAHTFNLHIANGYIELHSAAPEVTEGATENLIVTRTGDLSRPASVDYSTGSTTLVPASGTLDFAPGQSTRTFGVQAKDDTVWNEGAHRTATVFLHHPGTYFLLESSYPHGIVEELPISFSIADNDDPVRHRCTQPVTVSETAGFAVVDMERTGNLANATTGYAWIDSGGWELPLPWGTYTTQFLPGQAHAAIQIPVVNDPYYYGVQRTHVHCEGRGPGTVATASDILLTVNDDEPFPTVTAPARVEVDETDADQVVEVPVSVVPPFGRSSDLRLTLLHVTTSDDDAELLSWQGSAIRIRIAGDNLAEPDERMTLSIDGEVSKSIAVVIHDDDRPLFPYEFSRDDYDFQEEYAAVTILRTGDRSAAANLVLHVRASAPIQWDDAFPVSFAPGEASKEVVIPVQDDWFTGPRSATLELELDGFAGATASLTINDDESMPSLAIGGGSVREGGLDQKTRLEVPITLSAPAGYDVKVGVSLSHVTTDDADFFSTAPQTVTIFTGRLEGRAVFEVKGDIDQEDDEAFSVNVTSCCSGMATVANGTATAVILNDDGFPSGNVYRLGLGSTPVQEREKWLTVPVLRFGRIQAASRVLMRLTGGGRAFEPRQIYFAPAETRKEVRFYIDDPYFNGNGDVLVELFDGDRLLETGSAKIVDDESAPMVEAGALVASVREGDPGGAVTFRIYVTPPAPEPVTVHVLAVAGTANLGRDFGAFEGDLVIPAYGSSADVRIPIVDDAEREEVERFYLDVMSAQGAILLPRQYSWDHSAYVDVNDNDGAYLRYPGVVQQGTAATVTIELGMAAPYQELITIFPSVGGHVQAPANLLIPAGARSVPFEVQAVGEGFDRFDVLMPSFVNYKREVVQLRIDAAHTITLTPATLQLAPGTAARVEVAISGDNNGIYPAASSANRALAAVEFDRTSKAGARAVTVYAIATGRTEITFTLPYSSGSTTVTLPVVVAEPTSRRQGVRH